DHSPDQYQLPVKSPCDSCSHLISYQFWLERKHLWIVLFRSIDRFLFLFSSPNWKIDRRHFTG
ncbi:hypothetical protein Dimus_018770, partial [Dionaea muscipula]